MSRDVELRDPEDGAVWSLDNLSTQSWLDGQSVGAEAVVMWLKERATLLFAKEQDERAKWLRDLANEAKAEIVPRLKENALRHEREHPSRVETDPSSRPAT